MDAPRPIAEVTTRDEAAKEPAIPKSNKRQKKDKPRPAPVSEPDVIVPVAGPSTTKASSDLDDASDDDASEGELVHEALTSTSSRKRKQATKLPKYVPDGETAQERDRRSVFVGNLPVEVAKSKVGLLQFPLSRGRDESLTSQSAQSQLRTHLLSFAPTAKIESIRFRSIPFATPTDSVPDATDEDDKTKRAKREKLRAAAWRAEQDKLESGDKRDQEEADKAKSFIDAKGKRKVAFIKKDVSAFSLWLTLR